jgi:DNA-directed RNA polymerase
MPTEESMLQVCSMAPENVYWEYSAGIGNIFKSFVSILPERKFKHTRYAAILSKRIFDFILELFPAVHYIFYAKPWHKRMSFHLG